MNNQPYAFSSLKPQTLFLRLLLCTLVLQGLVLQGCFREKENPDLLRPPATVPLQARFMNLSTQEPLLLQLESTKRTNAVSFGALSSAIERETTGATLLAPIDSAFASVIKLSGSGGTLDSIAFTRRLRLLPRLGSHLVVSLPSAIGASFRAVDTLIVVSTSFVPDGQRPAGFVSFRVLNAVPDTSVFFSVIAGCPSSSNRLATQVGFRGVSLPSFAQPDSRLALSILQTRRVPNRADTTTVIGTYSLNAAPNGDYTIVMRTKTPSKADSLEVVALNNQTFAQEPIVAQPSASAELRVVNFTQEILSVQRGMDTLITDARANFLQQGFRNISTCLSAGQDTILVRGQMFRATASLTFDVNRRYSVFAAATSGGTTSTVVVARHNVAQPMSGNVLVRVVNLSPTQEAITLLGADAQGGMTKLLAAGARFGAVSDPVSLVLPSAMSTAAQPFPLLLMTASQPQRYIQALYGTVQAGKAYFLVLAAAQNSPANQPRLAAYLVPEEPDAPSMSGMMSGTPLQAMGGAELVQMLHTIANPPMLSYNIQHGNINRQIQLVYGVPTGVIVPAGMCSIGGASGIVAFRQQLSFMAEANFRSVVLSVNDSSGRILRYPSIYTIRGWTDTLTHFRMASFVNTVDSIFVVAENFGFSQRFSSAAIRNRLLSEIVDYRTERRQTLNFYTFQRSLPRATVSLRGFTMSLGKAYTFVLTSTQPPDSTQSDTTRFQILTIQEY